MSAPKLTPAAFELLARIEARQAKKARAEKLAAEAAAKREPQSFVGLGPNPLDFLK